MKYFVLYIAALLMLAVAASAQPDAEWISLSDGDTFFSDNVVPFNYSASPIAGDAPRWNVFQNGTLISDSQTNFSRRIANGEWNFTVTAYNSTHTGLNQSVSVTVDVDNTETSEWALASALFYVASVAFLAVVGFTFRDKVTRETSGPDGVTRKETNDTLVSFLKTLYFLILPAFALLGIRLAALTALMFGADGAIVDALWTAFSWMTGLYIFTAAVLLVLILKGTFSYLVSLLRLIGFADSKSKPRRMGNRGSR